MGRGRGAAAAAESRSLISRSILLRAICTNTWQIVCLSPVSKAICFVFSQFREGAVGILFRHYYRKTFQFGVRFPDLIFDITLFPLKETAFIVSVQSKFLFLIA